MNRPPAVKLKVPLLLPVVAFAAGIWLAPLAGGGWTLWIAAAAVCLLSVRYWRKAGVALLLVAAGIADSQWQTPRETGAQERTPSAFCGTVSRVSHSEWGTTLTLRHLSGGESWRGWEPRMRGGVRVSLPHSVDAREGDRVMVAARLRRVGGAEEKSAGFERYLEATGIGYTAAAKATDIVVVHNAKGIWAGLRDIGLRAGQVLDNSALNQRTAAFLRTLLFADRSDMPSDLRSDFTDAGLAHVLAVSGLHVGIIILILGVMLWPIGSCGEGRYRRGLQIIGVWLFAGITGMSPSVVRAAVMATFVLMADIVQQPNSSLNALAGAALVILAADPMALRDPGFQLSFTCVAGILVMMQWVRGWDTARTHRWLKVAGVVLVSGCALIVSWPLTSWWFGTVAPMGVVSSALVLPLLPCYMGLGLLYTVLQALGVAPDWMAWLLDSGLDMAATLARSLSADGRGVWQGVEVNGGVCALWLGGLALLAAAWLGRQHRRKMAAVGGALMAGALLVVVAGRTSVPTLILDHDGRHTKLLYSPTPGSAQSMILPEIGAVNIRAGGLRILNVGADAEAYAHRAGACDVLIVGSGYRGRIEDLAEATRARRVVIHPRRGIGGAIDAAARLRHRGVDVHISQVDGRRVHLLPQKGCESAYAEKSVNLR